MTDYRNGSRKYREAQENAEAAWRVYQNFVDLAYDKLEAGEIEDWPFAQLDTLEETAKSLDAEVERIWNLENSKRILTVEKSGPAWSNA